MYCRVLTPPQREQTLTTGKSNLLISSHPTISVEGLWHPAKISKNHCDTIYSTLTKGKETGRGRCFHWFQKYEQQHSWRREWDSMNSGARPEFLDGVFHPNINGMNAYRNAIIEEYNNYSSRTATRPKGKALSIGLMTIVNFHQGGLSVDSLWHFCLTKYGHAVECDEKSDLVKEIQSQGSSDTEVVVDTEQLPWPGSTYRLDIEGRKCDYRVMAVMPGDYFARTTSEIHGGSSEE